MKKCMKELIKRRSTVEGIRSTNISMITRKRKDLIIATNININMIIVTGKNILLMILLLKMNF